jgi:hypothetical protein
VKARRRNVREESAHDRRSAFRLSLVGAPRLLKLLERLQIKTAWFIPGQISVENASEVVREVGINNIRLPSMQPFLHLDHRLLGVAPRAVGVLLW